jgi:hypothetical protein
MIIPRTRLGIKECLQSMGRAFLGGSVKCFQSFVLFAFVPRLEGNQKQITNRY